MRVLLVAPELQDGGAERAWAVLAVSLVKRGHRVLGLTLAGEGGIFSELRARGVDVVCVGMHRRSDVHGWRRAIRIAHSFRPHLVVSRSVSAQVVGQLMAGRLKVPHVSVEQGDRAYRSKLTSAYFAASSDATSTGSSPSRAANCQPLPLRALASTVPVSFPTGSMTTGSVLGAPVHRYVRTSR